MVVDFEFNDGFIPTVDYGLTGFDPPGSGQLSNSPKTSLNYRAPAATGSLLQFITFFGVNTGPASFSAYSPPQTVIYSDSVQYGAAAFAFQAFISPTNILGGIYAPLPGPGVPPFITFTTSWSPASLYTGTMGMIWHPSAGGPLTSGAGPGAAVAAFGLGARTPASFSVVATSNARSFARIIGA
jgi:hypothetical protein